MSGAPQRPIWKNLNYKQIKNGRKYSAQCLFCGQTLTNIATDRLVSHRKRCSQKKNTDETIILEVDEIDTSAMGLNDSAYSVMDVSASSTLIDADNILFVIISSESQPSTTPEATPSSSSSSNAICFKEPCEKQKKKKQSGIKSYMDNMTAKEEDEINSLLSRFFYGCNISFNTVDSVHFRALVRKLRPCYEPKMPGRKALSTTLLDKEYNKQIQSTKNDVERNSVLLIDGWKNTASNSKTVVTMLHNANGTKVFLEAWDVSGEKESAEKLCEIIDESIKIAKTLYDTVAYAIVSDNAANMVRMGKDTNIWHSNCSAHVANLLCKNLLDKDLVSKVTTVLKEFRHPDLEKRVISKNGTKIKLPAETRWCTHRDSFVCLKQNLQIMRSIVAETGREGKTIKENVKNLLFDYEFEDDVGKMISILDPICILLNKVQSSSLSVADAAHLWLSLELPADTSRTIYERRIEQALNVYSLAAYYLHPYHDRNKLDPDKTAKVTDFLFNTMSGEALQELDLFLNRRSYFGVLQSKNLSEDACLYWRMASLKYPHLAETALKLINIPASSAQIERLFSNWNFIHSDLRNRLSFARSKKLLFIYYQMKIDQINEESDSEN